MPGVFINALYIHNKNLECQKYTTKYCAKSSRKFFMNIDLMSILIILQLLDNDSLVGRLKPTKPFELMEYLKTTQ